MPLGSRQLRDECAERGKPVRVVNERQFQVPDQQEVQSRSFDGGRQEAVALHPPPAWHQVICVGREQMPLGLEPSSVSEVHRQIPSYSVFGNRTQQHRAVARPFVTSVVLSKPPSESQFCPCATEQGELI